MSSPRLAATMQRLRPGRRFWIVVGVCLLVGVAGAAFVIGQASGRSDLAGTNAAIDANDQAAKERSRAQIETIVAYQRCTINLLLTPEAERLKLTPEQAVKICGALPPSPSAGIPSTPDTTSTTTLPRSIAPTSTGRAPPRTTSTTGSTTPSSPPPTSTPQTPQPSPTPPPTGAEILGPIIDQICGLPNNAGRPLCQTTNQRGPQ